MHMDLMQEEYPIDPEQGFGICRLKILTHLVQCGTRFRRFVSEGDLVRTYELENAWMNIAGGEITDDSFEGVVASTYNAMEQMLSDKS